MTGDSLGSGVSASASNASLVLDFADLIAASIPDLVESVILRLHRRRGRDLAKKPRYHKNIQSITVASHLFFLVGQQPRWTRAVARATASPIRSGFPGPRREP